MIRGICLAGGMESNYCVNMSRKCGLCDLTMQQFVFSVVPSGD